MIIRKNLPKNEKTLNLYRDLEQVASIFAS